MTSSVKWDNKGIYLIGILRVNTCRIFRSIPGTRKVLYKRKLFLFGALACSNKCARNKSLSHLPTHFHNAGTGFRASDSDVESTPGPQVILAVSIREIELQRGSGEGKALLTR